MRMEVRLRASLDNSTLPARAATGGPAGRGMRVAFSLPG